MTPRQVQSIPEDILDDLSSRFIINIPEEEREDPIRLCFQIELAHWFYLDFYHPENQAFRQCTMKEFTQMVFEHVPSLRVHLPNTDAIIESWKEYKMAVPTYGAIILDETLEHVLLVQAYWARATWGFPKGKVSNAYIAPNYCSCGFGLVELVFLPVWWRSRLKKTVNCGASKCNRLPAHISCDLLPSVITLSFNNRLS